MATSRLPQAVANWLSMLDTVGKSIGKSIAEVDARIAAEPGPPKHVEHEVTNSLNRIEQHFSKLTQRLEEADSTAAEVSAELLAAEELLRGWVDGIAVVAGRLTVPEIRKLAQEPS
jgi:hypothetical protein